MQRKKLILGTSVFVAVTIMIFLVTAIATVDNRKVQKSEISKGFPAQEVSITQKETYRGWIINNMGYSYIYEDRGLLQFNGTSRTALRYAETLNSLNERLRADNSFSIIVPTQAEYMNIPVSVMAEDNFFCTSQKEAVFVSADAYKDIVSIDVTELFGEHADEYLYFRTDYNWTSLGAYYAYNAFCDSVGITAVPLSAYEKIEFADYLGWFYTATNNQVLLDNADTLVYYRTEVEYPCYITTTENGHKTYTLKYTGTNIDGADGYDIFIGKTRPIYQFETRATGGSLLVIGDSSAHAFLPFLMAHYGEITFLNPSTFTEESYLVPKTDTVLYIGYATNVYAPEYCKNIDKISLE